MRLPNYQVVNCSTNKEACTKVHQTLTSRKSPNSRGLFHQWQKVVMSLSTTIQHIVLKRDKKQSKLINLAPPARSRRQHRSQSYKKHLYLGAHTWHKTVYNWRNLSKLAFLRHKYSQWRKSSKRGTLASWKKFHSKTLLRRKQVIATKCHILLPDKLTWLSEKIKSRRQTKTCYCSSS